MDRELTKTEIHNKKLEDLATEMRTEVKKFIKETVLKNAGKFNSIDDIRYFVNRFNFTASDLIDAGIRQEIWSKLEIIKDQDRKQRKGKKAKTKRTWENPRKK